MTLPINQIICGDCLEVMKTFPDKSIDLVITSPPYNLGNNHHTGNIRHNPYDDDLPEDEYQDQQVNVLNEIFRVLKDGGSLFYNHKNRIRSGVSIIPYKWIFRSKFLVKQELVWFNGSQNFDRIRFYPMTERVYWLVKDQKTICLNENGYHDLFKWTPTGTDNIHTRAFPERMVEDILSCFPGNSYNPEKIVLDPYCGSGTVPRIAKNIGKDFIGIEISQKYCDIAKQRLGQEVLF